MALRHENDFTPRRTEEERAGDRSRVISVRLNLEELRDLEADARILEQEKPATAIKLLMALGHNVLHHHFSGLVLRTVLDDRRKNQRTGISIPDPKFSQM